MVSDPSTFVKIVVIGAKASLGSDTTTKELVNKKTFQRLSVDYLPQACHEYTEIDICALMEVLLC